MTLPINRLAKYFPINGVNNPATQNPSEYRAEDQSLWISALTGGSSGAINRAAVQGDLNPTLAARKLVEEEAGVSSAPIRVFDTGYEEDLTPEETAVRMQNENKKRDEWVRTNSRFYMEQAAALGDPSISSELSRVATNLQIGQEVFEEAMREVKGGDQASIGRYAWDFLDRYLFRAFPIGGFEQVTNRNERKGQELLAAAATMSPPEYEKFIRAYADELKSEGFFTDENIFAIADGMAEFQNAGNDNLELINRVFGVADLAPALGVAKIAKLAKVTSPLKRVSALKGPEAAAETGEKILKANPNNPNPRVVNDFNPDALDPNPPSPVHVPSNRITRIVSENRIIQGIKHLNERNVFVRGKGSDEAKRATEEALKVVRSSFANPLVNVTNPLTRDATGGFKLDMTFGTIKTGAPYKTKAAAERVAARMRSSELPTAHVIPVDETDEAMGYYVRAEQRLDVDAQAPELSTAPVYDAIRTGLARFFGSKAATENSYLNILASAAEAGASSVGRLVKQDMKRISKLNTREKRAMSQIMTDLRDGPDAFVREGYTPAEFAQKWKQYTGSFPSEKVTDAWDSLQSINDASWAMRAHGRLQKYVERGYWGLEFPDNVRIPAKKTDEPLGDTAILDVSQGTLFLKSELRKSTVVWKLDREIDGGIQYVVNPSRVDVLQHGDVLGYNAGGRRLNPNANHFIVAGDNSPRAFLTAFTTDQAQSALDQIKKVKEAVSAKGGLKNINKVSDLDELVLANNDWNPELQTFQQWLDYFKTKNIDPELPFYKKVRDAEIETGAVKDEFSTTWGEYVTFGMHRADDVLTEYGGKEAYQHNPVEALFQDFTSITHHYSQNVYTQSAMKGWLKAARRQGSGWEVPATADTRAAFEGARMTAGASRQAGELGRQRAIVRRRLGIKSEVFQALENYGAQMQEYVFGKTGGVVKLPRDPVGTAGNAMLSLGFQSAFGLGNVSQFFVQGYHAATITAISPKHGFKGAGMTPGMMMILSAADPSEKVVAIRRLAKVMQMPEQDVLDLVEYIHTSGRNIIDGATIENGTGAAWGVSGWKGQSFLPARAQDAATAVKATAKGTLSAGLTFFRQGERLSRLTGINTAFLEFKAKFPDVSPMSEFGREWITKREQALSFRMTNANRSFAQEGFGKLPTQWFTYTLRTMENVVIGRDFTAAERARMAVALGPMFGLTGMGLGSATDYIGEKIGAEPAGLGVTALKYGFWDWAIEAVTGQETALAERLSPITLLQDVYGNIAGDKPAYEVLGGPSTDITFGMLDQVFNVLHEAMYGQSIALTDDSIRTMRQFTGVDNYFRAMGILQNGQYRGRNGNTLPFELSTSDAVMQFMGFTPREVHEWYQEKQWRYRADTDVKDFAAEMEQDWSLAVQAWREGNEDGAIELMKIIDLKIKTSGFAMYDQRKIQRSLRRSVNREIWEMIRYHMQRENQYHARKLERTFDNPGENG